MEERPDIRTIKDKCLDIWGCIPVVYSIENKNHNKYRIFLKDSKTLKPLHNHYIDVDFIFNSKLFNS